MQLNSTILTLVTRGFGRARILSGSIPPTSLVLLASLTIQVGSALTKSLFDTLGVSGAALITKGFAALLLILICRPQWKTYRRQDYFLAGWLGIAMALMTLGFFGAIARIPLGVASTIEFTGPLGVAVVGSRRPLDFLWVILAATGVLLFDPIGGSTSLDPVGIAMALGSAGCWAAYILLSVPAGQVFPGGTGLTLGMGVATLILIPPGFLAAGTALFHPYMLIVGLAVALVGVVLPYSLEYTALKRMPARVFGVLLSMEPAIAALVGFLVLGEHLEIRTLVAIALVTVAAIGVTLWGKHSSHS